MAKKKEVPRPFFDVKHEYEASLKEYVEASHMLFACVRTLLNIFEDDPNGSIAHAKLKELLQEHVDRLERASTGL